VSPPHVTLNQVFAGMMPHMLIVNLCLAFMYLWPGMTLWPPEFLYGNQAATAARPSQANRRRHP
jgi:TRAP-type mannitol/chloroaromatic compound transport system permease large subunit